ncbi:unnamed protein product [Prunus armeniaca]|uniref:Sugar phosphate transporter domain-containing protein n=1 Tax=Prunus armeniaca TaxID=36596 RepID=A0A6J5WNU6_PRUAR|nr:unnamed protein product [Prunus armeniaca]
MKGKSRLFTIGLVTAWYSSNIGVLLLNKYLLSNYGFKYPIFLTMCHMTACSLLSYIAIAWMKMVPMQTIRSRVQFLKITALSLVFCVSVVLGTFRFGICRSRLTRLLGPPRLSSLRGHHCKWGMSSSFLLISALLLQFKYITENYCEFWKWVCFGRELSNQSVNWWDMGWDGLVAATAARALKSVLQGILLSSEGYLLYHSGEAEFHEPPSIYGSDSCCFLLPATLIMEENVVGITLALARDDVKIIWYLLFNSALAYFVNLTNFLVTKHTSALTLQHLEDFMNNKYGLGSIEVAGLSLRFKLIKALLGQWYGQKYVGLEKLVHVATLSSWVLGNAKGAVAVVVSILIFRNPVSVTGMMGYSLTVFGVILYSEAKKRTVVILEASWHHMLVPGFCLYEFYFSPGGLSEWLPFVSATTQDKSKVGNLISD